MEKHTRTPPPARALPPLGYAWGLTEEEQALLERLTPEPPEPEGSTWEQYQDEHAFPAWL